MPIFFPPALVAICGALLALLILWGVVVIVRAIAKIIPDSGFPGAGALHSLLVNLATAAMEVVQWVMSEFIRPVINFVLAPVFRFIDYMRALGTFAHSMADSWTWLIGTELPQVFGKVEHAIAHALAAAEHWAADKIKALHTLLHAGILAARHFAANLVHAARVELHLAIHAAKAALWSGIHGVEHDLSKGLSHAEHLAAAATAAVAADLFRIRDNVWAGIHGVEHDLTKLVTSTAATTLHAAEHFTTVAIRDIVGGLTVDIPGVIAPVWDGVISDVGALEGVIATDFPDLRGLLRTLPGTDVLDVTAAIAGGLTLSRVMTRYMTECGIPNCRNLSGVGRALQSLFGLVEGAAFLAILADMIADPKGAAAEAEGVMSAIVDPLVSGGRELLGV